MSNNSIASNVNEISVQSEEEIQMLPNAKTRQTKVSFKENRYVKSKTEKNLSLPVIFGGDSFKEYLSDKEILLQKRYSKLLTETLAETIESDPL